MKFKFSFIILLLSSSMVFAQSADDIITTDHTPDVYEITGSEEDYNRMLIINPVKGDRNEALKYHETASAYYRKKQYDMAEVYWMKSIIADPSWGRSYYNLACICALKNEKQLAIGLVEKALRVSNGELLERIRKDRDLDSIRNESDFKVIISRYEK